MDSSQLKWIEDLIWGIADDVLRDIYVRGKYRDVIRAVDSWLASG
jgi:type I restriction enzyme M protein